LIIANLRVTFFSMSASLSANVWKRFVKLESPVLGLVLIGLFYKVLYFMQLYLLFACSWGCCTLAFSSNFFVFLEGEI
jgi:hypothetical protein